MTVRNSIIFALGILLLAAATRFATSRGAPFEAEIARRAMNVFLGGFFIVTGNAIPKTLKPLSARCDPARVQSFQRLAGWTWVLTGLGFSLAWLFLPLGPANSVSMVILFAGMLLVLEELFRLFRSQRRETR